MVLPCGGSLEKIQFLNAESYDASELALQGFFFRLSMLVQCKTLTANFRARNVSAKNSIEVPRPLE